jgi:hypothetical protein
LSGEALKTLHLKVLEANPRVETDRQQIVREMQAGINDLAAHMPAVQYKKAVMDMCNGVRRLAKPNVAVLEKVVTMRKMIGENPNQWSPEFKELFAMMVNAIEELG